MNPPVLPPTPTARTSRRRRNTTRAIRLRERDIDILLALGKMRLLRTSDLSRLFFDAVGTCQKRLRKLFDAGLVRAVVTELAAENRFALTRLGHDLLARALDEDEVPAWRPAPRVDGRSVAHLDLLNRYRIALACETPKFGVRLVRFVPEWDIRATDPSAPIVPDALVVIATGQTTATLALEIDTGTEPASTVAKKIDAYDRAELARTPVFGVVAPKILIVTSTARRARSVARAIAHAPAGPTVWLGAAPFVLDNGGMTSGVARVGAIAAKDAVPGTDDFQLGLLGALQRSTGAERAAPMSPNEVRAQTRAVPAQSAIPPRATATRPGNAAS